VQTILTERLLLRQWREADRAPFRAMNSDPRVMQFFPNMLTSEESDRAMDRIQAKLEERGWGLWAAELRADGSLLGFIGLSAPGFDANFLPAIEIGWRLRCEAWGKGLATEGARAAMRFGFENVGLSEIVSFTTAANLRSRRVMEKLRMRHHVRDDFDHPQIAEGHPLRRHVLYRISKEEWLAA
jgi:RimJ/RimL family protein N-acetyltransferase